MKLLGLDRVLCISPHPDDVEYSMALTIRKYKDTHFTILCMSHGGLNDPTSGSDRLIEVDSFWKWLVAFNVNTLHRHIYLQDKSEAEWVADIEQVLYDTNAQAMFIPSAKDTHPDHKLVNSIGIQASRKQSISIIEYKSPSSTTDWQPSMFVQVTSGDVSYKHSCLTRAFGTQTDAFYFQKETIDMFHRDFFSYKRQIPYVELFNVVQLYNIGE